MGVLTEGPHRTPEIRRQDGQLESDPDGPPFARPVAAVERQQAARSLHREHADCGGRSRPGQEPTAAVLGLEPLPAVHPQAWAALDPVGGRPRDAQRLRHGRAEQLTRSGGDHIGLRADHVDGAGAQVDDNRVAVGAWRGERPEAGRSRLGDRGPDGHGQQIAEQAGRRSALRAGCAAQRRHQERPAGTPLPGGSRLGCGGQVHGEQVIDLGLAETPHGTDRPAGQVRACDAQRQATAVGRPDPWLIRGEFHRAGRRGEQAHHSVALIGQRPAQRDGVRGLKIGQPEPGAERDRVGQQAQRVPGRAHLDREQLAGGRRGSIDLVDDRQLAGQPMSHQHALVARHQDRADRRPGRQQLPQPGGGLVVAHADRNHHDDRRPGRPLRGWPRPRCIRAGQRQRRADARAGSTRRGHARGQHPQPAPGRRGVGHGHQRGVHRAQRGDPGLGGRASRLALDPADQCRRAAQRVPGPLPPAGRHASRSQDLPAGDQHHLGGGVADVHPGNHRHQIRLRRAPITR
jgi:hypothetical protein